MDLEEVGSGATDDRAIRLGQVVLTGHDGGVVLNVMAFLERPCEGLVNEDGQTSMQGSLGAHDNQVSVEQFQRLAFIERTGLHHHAAARGCLHPRAAPCASGLPTATASTSGSWSWPPPPGQRDRQLWLVHELYPLLSQPEVLEAMRAAKTDDEVRRLLTTSRTARAS